MTGSGTRPARRRLVIATVGTLLVALVAAGAFVAVRLRTNITVLDVDDALASAGEPVAAVDETGLADGPDEPPTEPDELPEAETGPLNVLVMGSDTREGQGDGFGSAALIDGARSDTTLLVHLSADRQDVTVVSIPRDLVVTLPACTLPDGTLTDPYQDRFNAAFSIGGPECTIRTVNALTGLPIHHFVVVDFTAFERAIDALGGVEVCLTRAVADPKAGLDLPAGVSRVDGQQALAFVRARESLGDGSDLARIERQQSFLGSLVREATSRGLLTDPVRLIRSLDAATQSLTMDPGLARLPQAASLATGLAGVEPSRVSFVTLPYQYNDDRLTVRPDPVGTTLLVEALAADTAWPFPSGSQAVPLDPSAVAVSVVNATGAASKASLAGSALDLQGFSVTGLDTRAPQTLTQVRHPAGLEQEASTVAAAVDGAVLVRDDAVAGVELVLGQDFTLDRLRTVVVAQPQTPEPSSSPPPAEWLVPADPLPSNETLTAQTSVCAS